MQKRKGFTLVELVIVIAVIAILAGVLIGTFASVINRANESARMQELKAQEIEQKAEDILKKIEDSNWYGWEDFEASLVAKMTEAYKKNSTASITEDTILKVVRKALDEFATSQASQHTSLTEEQVKAIVENAIGGISFSGVTEAQVRAIVGTATSSVLANQLTVSQIRTIVNAANENNLTPNDLAKALASLPSNTTIANLEANVTSAINGLTAQMLTEEQVANVLKALVPVTETAEDADDAEQLFKDLVSGSTIILGDGVTGDLEFEISDTETKTIIIANNSATAYDGTVTISGARATVYLIGDFKEVVAEKVDTNSLHVLGKVTSLTVNQGRAVVEGGAIVSTLTAMPNKNATVVVVVEESAKVTELNAQYQDHGYTEGNRDYIEIENNGEVGGTNITASAALVTSKTTTTNVVIKNGRGSTGSTVEEIFVDTNVGSFDVTVDETGAIANANTQKVEVALFAGGKGTETEPYLISTAKQLQNMEKLSWTYYALGAYYGLPGFEKMNWTDACTFADGQVPQGIVYFKVKTGVENIECSNWNPIYFDGTFDGNGVNFINLDNTLFAEVGMKTNTVFKNYTVSCKIITSDAFKAAVVDTVYSDISFVNVDVHGYVQAGQCASYIAFGPGQSTVINYSFTDCHSDCTLVAVSEQTAGFIDHPYCKDTTENTLTLVNSYYDGKQSNTKGEYNYYTYQTFGRLTVSDDNSEISTLASNNTYVKANSTTKLTKGDLTLSEVGEVFTIAKAENATYAVASLFIGPNDKNETGNYVGTYMAEECVLNNNTFTTKNIRNYNITVNEDTTTETGVIGNTFNIVSNSYGTTYGSASVIIIQYDAEDNIVAIHSVSIKR